MIKDLIKKADLILLAVLLVTGLTASFAVARSGAGGGQVVIKSAGQTIGSYPLGEDRTFMITKDGKVSDYDKTGSQKKAGYNILQIKDGKADMIEADCHNQVCVDHKPVSKGGENIICLPHKIVVEIEKQKGDDGYDSLAK